MADWSQLPKDILLLTAKLFNTRLDVTRFRSVCSSWRSSVPSKPRRLPAHCQLPPGNYRYIDSLYLSTCTIFLIRLPENRNQWLVKTEEDEHERMHLLNPLSNSEFGALPNDFPKVLDLSIFQVIELGHEYVVQYSVDLQHDMEGVYGKYTKKVVLLWLSSESDDFVLLAFHNYGIMAIYRSRDKQWSALENTHQWFDFISFNGKFHGLDQMGRTLVVEPSSKMSVLPHVVHLGPHCMKKLFVESGGQLLMVDVYLNKRKWKRPGFPDEITERLGSNTHKMMAWFDVFKLDEAGL